MSDYDYAAVYRDARHRVTALVRDASPAGLATTVPGCPEWTVADTVAHLAAIASDVLAGRLDRMPTPEQTGEQVARRRGLPLSRVLDEWERAGPGIEQAVADRKVPLNVVHDAVTHEADLRGALDAGRPPERAWQASLAHLSRGFDRQLGRDGSLAVTAGQQGFIAGSGEPETGLDVDPYEFWRALFGRRSREQMRAWAWHGRPEPYLDAIPAFGPTRTALAEPA